MIFHWKFNNNIAIGHETKNWSSVVIYTPLVNMADHMVDRVENPAGRVSFVIDGDLFFKIDEV